MWSRCTRKLGVSVFPGPWWQLESRSPSLPASAFHCTATRSTRSLQPSVTRTSQPWTFRNTWSRLHYSDFRRWLASHVLRETSVSDSSLGHLTWANVAQSSKQPLCRQCRSLTFPVPWSRNCGSMAFTSGWPRHQYRYTRTSAESEETEFSADVGTLCLT